MPLPTVEALFTWYEYVLWRSLLFLALLPSLHPPIRKPPEYTPEQTARLDSVKNILERVQGVENSPSLACKILLVRAELARVEGDHVKAQELYEESVESARQVRYLCVLGYASEQAMKFYLSKKLDRAATGHFREARAAYFSWGAFAKTKQLEAKYSFLMYDGVGYNSGNITAGSGRAQGLDLTSVLKACQVLSSEIDPVKLIANMVKIVIQNAGAHKGCFIVPDIAGRLFIEAQGEAGTEEVQRLHYDLTEHGSPATTSPEPLSTNGTSSPTATSSAMHVSQSTNQLAKQSSLNGMKAPTYLPPSGIIQYAYRTKTHVLLDDACQEGMFIFEPHVQANKTKSVLCMPVINQSKVVAILYLENNLMTGAFTAERLEVVQLLSSQLGISFENATLYKNLQTANVMLEKKNKELTALDHIKDQFLANTSHELRTPLNGIIGLAESLIDGATGELSQATCNNLAMIVNSGKRLAHLVNDILDLSALKAGSLTIRPRPTNLRNTLDDVLFLSSHLIGTKDLRLVDITADLPTMNVDEARIQQVLQNVIGNAIKFTHEGTVTISSRTTDDWIEIQISDSGCGIPETELEAIFEDFKQVDGSSSREVGGTGLGLSIARRLIELHNGKISVRSEMNIGSTFIIHLPISLKIDTTAAANIIQSEGHWGTHSHKTYKEGEKTTILSVDDDPTNQVVLQRLLSPHFNVVQAMSGSEALEIINNSSQPPDFVLLDVMMPRMSGLEVCEKVREKYPMCDLPIIMVSAKNRPEHIVEGLSRGANDYVSKPVNREELLARIRAQLMICHSCRMVCKNPVGSPHGEDVFICENCQHKKTKVSRSRRQSLDFVTNLVNEAPNTLELVHHLPFLVTLYSTDGRVAMRNPASRLWHEGLGMDIPPENSFLPHVLDRSVADRILSEAKGKDVYEPYVEVHSPTPTFHRIWAKHITMSLPTSSSSSVYIMVVEIQVGDAKKDLDDAKKLDKIRNELLIDLAHNLKSPLSGIISLAESLHEPPTPLLLSTLATSARRISRSIDEIMEYADHVVKEGGGAVQVNIVEALETSEMLLRAASLVQNVAVEKEIPHSLPPVLAPSPKLTALLSSLLDISIRYTSSNSLVIRVGEEGHKIVVRFCDDSGGMPIGEIDELFARGPSQGYLAPAIAQRAAEALGATINFTKSAIEVKIPQICGPLPPVPKDKRRRYSLFSQTTLPRKSPPTRKLDRLKSLKSSEPIHTLPSSPRPHTHPSSPRSHPHTHPTSPRSHTLPSSPRSSFSASPPTTSSSTTSSPRNSSASTPHIHRPHSPYPPAPHPTPYPPSLSSSSTSNYGNAWGHSSILFGIPDPDRMPGISLEAEVKELTMKLAVAKSILQIRKVTVKFKSPGDRFCHKVNLEAPTIDQLRREIAKRLKLDPNQQFQMVRDGDTLVDQEEDIVDGISMEIFV